MHPPVQRAKNIIIKFLSSDLVFTVNITVIYY